jgi:hypothetical protein
MIWTTVKALLSSKKFIAALLAALVWLGGKVGLHVDTETLAGIVGPIVAYVLGQGIADHGKEAALIAGKSSEGN